MCGTGTGFNEYGRVGIETVGTKFVNQSDKGTGMVVLPTERKIEAKLHVILLSFNRMHAFSHHGQYIFGSPRSFGFAFVAFQIRMLTPDMVGTANSSYTPVKDNQNRLVRYVGKVGTVGTVVRKFFCLLF